ncbi:B-cell linker protein isoform X1 [Gymnodraco acuticeps]|uniref:B-cell linker protein isoform X1 n=2 Tax=Gymnodraco acuticeps TaxID=8218 RepID=A0A6P8UU61_GYMAC|nr:B-cell linker protein isoform X1 [Gymnodraco acuticeps]
MRDRVSLLLYLQKYVPAKKLPVETKMNLPSREECEGWDPAQVAFFLGQNKMAECAGTVNRLRIDGHRLLSLSDSDMNKFSLVYQPQLQKIVQDIKKNDGSLLNKLRRLKSKPVPKVPARDYRDFREDEERSDSDYDNDMYEDPHEEQDDNYEPPPSHKAFTPTPSASFPRGEYLDNCRSRPGRLPRKPLRPGKGSRQLPPEPPLQGSDEEDYINPDCSNDDDNYIEPAENPPSNPMMHCGSKAGRDRPMMPTPLTERSPSPDFYEVPDKEGNSLSLPANRRCPIPATQSPSTPPKPSPRANPRRSPTPVQKPSDDDEYEVCDPEDSSTNKRAEGPPRPRPKPLPRERSPIPPVKPKPEFKPREFESRTLPVMQKDLKPQRTAFTLDSQRPKIPFPQMTFPKPTDRGSVIADNGTTDQDKDAGVYKKSWYASACDRKTADDALCRSGKDGAFMVRRSSGQDTQQPYTLVVFYKGRVYNIPIRFIAGTKQYALGREKKGEEFFSSISHIVENHQRHPLVLIDSQSNSKDAVRLSQPVTP